MGGRSSKTTKILQQALVDDRVNFLNKSRRGLLIEECKICLFLTKIKTQGQSEMQDIGEVLLIWTKMSDMD